MDFSTETFDPLASESDKCAAAIKWMKDFSRQVREELFKINPSLMAEELPPLAPIYQPPQLRGSDSREAFQTEFHPQNSTSMISFPTQEVTPSSETYADLRDSTQPPIEFPSPQIDTVNKESRAIMNSTSDTVLATNSTHATIPSGTRTVLVVKNAVAAQTTVIIASRVPFTPQDGNQVPSSPLVADASSPTTRVMPHLPLGITFSTTMISKYAPSAIVAVTDLAISMEHAISMLPTDVQISEGLTSPPVVDVMPLSALAITTPPISASTIVISPANTTLVVDGSSKTTTEMPNQLLEITLTNPINTTPNVAATDLVIPAAGRAISTPPIDVRISGGPPSPLIANLGHLTIAAIDKSSLIAHNYGSTVHEVNNIAIAATAPDVITSNLGDSVLMPPASMCIEDRKQLEDNTGKDDKKISDGVKAMNEIGYNTKLGCVANSAPGVHLLDCSSPSVIGLHNEAMEHISLDQPSTNHAPTRFKDDKDNTLITLAFVLGVMSTTAVQQKEVINNKRKHMVPIPLLFVLFSLGLFLLPTIHAIVKSPSYSEAVRSLPHAPLLVSSRAGSFGSIMFSGTGGSGQCTKEEEPPSSTLADTHWQHGAYSVEPAFSTTDRYRKHLGLSRGISNNGVINGTGFKTTNELAAEGGDPPQFIVHNYNIGGNYTTLDGTIEEAWQNNHNNNLVQSLELRMELHDITGGMETALGYLTSGQLMVSHNSFHDYNHNLYLHKEEFLGEPRVQCRGHISLAMPFQPIQQASGLLAAQLCIPIHIFIFDSSSTGKSVNHRRLTLHHPELPMLMTCGSRHVWLARTRLLDTWTRTLGSCSLIFDAFMSIKGLYNNLGSYLQIARLGHLIGLVIGGCLYGAPCSNGINNNSFGCRANGPA